MRRPLALGAACLLAAALVPALAPAVAPSGGRPVPFRPAAASSSTLESGTGVTDAVRIAATPDGQGFYVLATDGSVHAYGDAVQRGDAALPHPAVAMAVTADGGGYWVFDANGCTQGFGDAATFSASVCGTKLNGPILDAAATPIGARLLAGRQ